MMTEAGFRIRRSRTRQSTWHVGQARPDHVQEALVKRLSVHRHHVGILACSGTAPGLAVYEIGVGATDAHARLEHVVVYLKCCQYLSCDLCCRL